MRPKVDIEKKRDILIGVKVDKTTKAKIDYIAKREGDATSTYIFNLINDHIKQYTQYARIKWEEEL